MPKAQITKKPSKPAPNPYAGIVEAASDGDLVTARGLATLFRLPEQRARAWALIRQYNASPLIESYHENE